MRKLGNDLFFNKRNVSFENADKQRYYSRVFWCQKFRNFTVTIKARYHKVPKFSDARKLCCNLPKSQTKRPNLRVFCQKHANGIANSEDPDQTAPLGSV